MKTHQPATLGLQKTLQNSSEQKRRVDAVFSSHPFLSAGLFPVQPLPAWLWKHRLHSSPHKHPDQVNWRRVIGELIILQALRHLQHEPVTLLWPLCHKVASWFLLNSYPVKTTNLKSCRLFYSPALVCPRTGLLSSHRPTVVFWLTISGKRNNIHHCMRLCLLFCWILSNFFSSVLFSRNLSKSLSPLRSRYFSEEVRKQELLVPRREVVCGILRCIIPP